MSQFVEIAAETPRPRFSGLGGDLLAIAVIFVVYTLTVWVALDLSFADAVAGGAANTVPVVVAGAAVRHIIASRLSGRSLVIQAAGHVVLCAAFALLSFWILIILLGLEDGRSPFEFSVQPFPLRATAWQLLENVTTYGVIAALTYLGLARRQMRQQAPSFAEVGRLTPVEPPAYFVRSGDEIRPIDFDRVICIAGADDYAEVRTLDGKHLVRMTLTEFEKTLDAGRFARVHRSWIVNLSLVNRAEPAGGGRLLLYMEGGETISASRTGSRRLRDRVI